MCVCGRPSRPPLPARRSGAAPTNVIKHLVSKNKKRFVEGGFDLDLFYVTPRVIAMGFPSEKVEGLYRNALPDVQAFFQERHPGHFKIYNLCSERAYEHAKFNDSGKGRMGQCEAVGVRRGRVGGRACSFCTCVYVCVRPHTCAHHCVEPWGSST